MIDTTKLRELAEKSTPGPWKIVSDALHFYSLTSIFAGEVDHKNRIPAQMIVDVGGNDECPQLEANTRFIAAANPATVLALLDELDRLRNVESATLQGEKIGCRCRYTDNQTVDTECLYHRAIRSERDRLRAELTAMRENLNDAAQCIANQSQTISRLQDIESAALNLAKVKGRHNSEIAMNQLLEALR